jgi:hypothetical protein
MVILDSVKRAGKPSGDLAKDRTRVRDALVATDMKLSQGRVKFGKDGQVADIIPSVVQVRLSQDCKPDTQIIYPADLAVVPYESPKPWNQRQCK